jgi:hypothetical protein
MSELRQRHLAESSAPPNEMDQAPTIESVDWKKDKEDTLSYGKTPDGKGKEEYWEISLGTIPW